MDRLAPLGPVYQAGTLSGNPLAMAAGLKTMEILRRPGTYERLETVAEAISSGWMKAAQDAGFPAQLHRVGSMFTLFFTGAEVRDYATAKSSDLQRFGAFFRGMRARGVSLPASQFEAAFASLALSDRDVEMIVTAGRETLTELAQQPH